MLLGVVCHFFADIILHGTLDTDNRPPRGFCVHVYVHVDIDDNGYVGSRIRITSPL